MKGTAVLVLDPASGGAPDMFVHLYLKPNRQPIVQDPFGQGLRVEHTKDRAEQHWTAREQLVLPHDGGSPLVIGSVLYDEFHLVMAPQAMDIVPVHAIHHATARAFHVENNVGAWIDRRSVDGSARFKQNLESRVTQDAEQVDRALLAEGRAPCYFDERAAELLDLGQHVFQREVRASIKRVVRVAPGAAQGTARQPDEHAGTARMGGFSLDTVEDFGDFQCGGHVQDAPSISAILSLASRAVEQLRPFHGWG